MVFFEDLIFFLNLDDRVIYSHHNFLKHLSIIFIIFTLIFYHFFSLPKKKKIQNFRVIYRFYSYWNLSSFDSLPLKNIENKKRKHPAKSNLRTKTPHSSKSPTPHPKNTQNPRSNSHIPTLTSPYPYYWLDLEVIIKRDSRYFEIRTDLDLHVAVFESSLADLSILIWHFDITAKWEEHKQANPLEEKINTCLDRLMSTYGYIISWNYIRF